MKSLRRALALTLPLLAPAVSLVDRASGVLLLTAMSAWCIYWLPYVPVGPFQTAKDIVLCSAVAAVWIPVIFGNLARFSVTDPAAAPEAGGVEDAACLGTGLPARAQQLYGARLAIRPWTPEALLVVALCVATLPGVIFSPAPLGSFQYWWRIAAALALFLTFRQVLADGRLEPRHAFTAIVAPAALSAASLLLAKLAPPIGMPQPPEPHYQGLARAGLSYTYGAFSWHTALAAPLAWGLLATISKPVPKVLLACVLLTMLGGVVLSAGRGGLVAVALAGGAIALARSRKVAATYVVVLVLIGAGAFFLWPTTLQNRYLKLYPRKHLLLAELQGTSLGTLDGMAASRVSIDLATARLALQHPLTGVGLGQFSVASRELLGMQFDAHNFYLALAADSGVVSALVALAFTTWCLVFSARALRALSGTPWLRLSAAMQALTLVGLFQTLFERGDLFLALHAGLPFWVTLACLRDWHCRSTSAVGNLPSAHGKRASQATVTSSRPRATSGGALRPLDP